jgi:beta-1,4-mannosyl-glycoprotein beta-1,4-N-acetylglucosaminyltransferase
MKIFDCFMYFDEEAVLDVRLNTLNKFVDYFVVIESKFTHKGDLRDLKFNHKKFEKFKDKIIYLIYEQEPKEIEIVNSSDSEGEKSRKYIFNAAYRENGQRNHIEKGLVHAKKDDIILISDVDEIPNLSGINFSKINEKIILFKQDMFYYKFNLYLPNLIWTGTKGCKKKYLLNPQWLRNVKDRKYPFYRIDTIFSKNKYKSIRYVNNGGWHFTNIKTAKEIQYKLKSYLHHREFDVSPLSVNQIDEIIKNKKAIYNLNVDKSVNKFESGNKLEKFEFNKLPTYIQKNKDSFKDWIDE